MVRYKCYTCKLVLNEGDLVDGNCPECGLKDGLKEMCIKDHCHCGHDMVSGVAVCPICDEFVCPTCGSHDVFVISRVTGYLAEVSGYNSGKQAEFKDRTRYKVT